MNDIKEILKKSKEVYKDSGSSAAYFYLIGALEQYNEREIKNKQPEYVLAPKKTKTILIKGGPVKPWIFKVLQRYNEWLTSNEIVKLLELDFGRVEKYPTVSRALGVLVQEGNVEIKKKSRREYYYRISKENALEVEIVSEKLD